MNTQLSLEEPEVYDAASTRISRGNGRVYVYEPGSLWSHIKYGLGTLAVIVIPPLIPGVTGRGLIMGYLGALFGGLFLIIIWGMLRSFYSGRKRG